MRNTLSRLASFCGALAIVACAATAARADTISIVGVDTGGASTATVVCTFNSQTNTFTFTVTNTSPSASTITGIGFDLVAGDFDANDPNATGLNGFTGMQAPSLSSDFDFSDGALGNVPHGFGNSVVLDFGFVTGTDFANGMVSAGLAPGESASFTVSGAGFAGFTEAQICNAIFVRFQNVPVGPGSDVGRPTTAPIPEPATMILLGTGLAGVAGAVRRRRKGTERD